MTRLFAFALAFGLTILSSGPLSAEHTVADDTVADDTVADDTVAEDKMAEDTVAEDGVEQRVFHQCVLYRGADGNVWLGQPLVSLGMIGVMANPPQYRLSPPLAKQYAPLVNELAETPDKPQFWWWGLPLPNNPNHALILVRVAVTAKLITPAADRDPLITDAESPGSSLIYEITSAELIYGEFVSAAWLRAWKTLNAGLGTIVAVSRTEPGERKTRELSDAIRRCGEAYNTMVALPVSEETRQVMRKIAPTARAVRLFQQGVAGSEAGEWGGQLRRYCATLKIQPPTPLVPAATPCPAIELLIKSTSGAELISRIRSSWPEEALDQRLVFSNHLNRIVFVWEVADLNAAQFTALQSEAKEQLKRIQAAAVPETMDTGEDEFAIPDWGVVFRAAGPELLANTGLLSGMVVIRLTSESSSIGLQEGDIVIDYQSPYDLVMGRFPHHTAQPKFKGIVQYGGELAVLRGNRRLNVAVNVRK